MTAPPSGPRLGILDWGIGGFGLYKLIKRTAPALPITYWSDAGTAPYGTLPAAVLRARVREVAQALAREGVTHLAIACNAASTVLPLAGAGLPASTGVLEHGAAVARQARGVIGVVGGRRTIVSGAYRRALPGRSLHQRVAQPISAFIERGELTGAALEHELDRIMAPLREVDALVLACTHYPAIAGAFAMRAPHARIIDPVAHLWSWIQARWPLAQLQAARADDRFLTTGDPQAMQRAARAAFGVRVPRVRRVV